MAYIWNQELEGSNDVGKLLQDKHNENDFRIFVLEEELKELREEIKLLKEKKMKKEYKPLINFEVLTTEQIDELLKDLKPIKALKEEDKDERLN